MYRVISVLIPAVALAFLAVGCRCCPKGEAAGSPRSSHLVFNPEITGSVAPDNVRADWPAVSSEVDGSASVVYRETLSDYQGRFFFHGNDYVRRFRSIREGTGRR